MNPYVAEFLGTMLLVLIGDGVCANASLTKTKGNESANWLLISTGWALAVYVAVICTQEASGAHINPAVSIGLAAAGKFAWADVAPYVTAQMAGGFVGAVLVYLFYIQHFSVTDDANAKLGTFCTGPAIRGLGHNLFSEVVGTFVLVFAVLMAGGAMLTMGDGSSAVDHKIGLGAVGALPVALVVFAIGIGFGGTTGYAINPARDFSPRLAHALLPIPGKRDSDWGYAWVPVVGPVLGGIVAAIIYQAIVTPPT
jgi:glycerol uptake facilitator protein